MVYGYFKRGSYDCATIYRFMDIHSPFFGRFAIDITIQGMKTRKNRKGRKNMFDAYKIKGTPAEITYSLAWLIYEERYSRSDAEYMIAELLGNEFHYDGRDFSGYVELYKTVNDDDKFEPDYDGALEILNNVETI